jgi:hypothetical protein
LQKTASGKAMKAQWRGFQHGARGLLHSIDQSARTSNQSRTATREGQPQGLPFRGFGSSRIVWLFGLANGRQGEARLFG